MPNIQVLDSHVADLIAAGEVVERPASVAKELMENAIDAGACKVTVEISHGGLTFLRVTDDGKGIPAAELPTAFLRHATSKLRRASDLEAIGTLGFRGEALAAIAAVSRVEVMTRTADSPLGASLSLEGGVAGPVEEAGCPLGTTMVVPRGQPASSTGPATPPSREREAPRGLSAVRVMTSTRDTAAMAARASPRKPRVPMASRSLARRSLLVAWRRKAVGSSAAGMPLPSSVTRRKVRPPWEISTVTLQAPASMAFSMSSLATLAGRSTTSPAAMRSATWESKT